MSAVRSGVSIELPVTPLGGPQQYPATALQAGMVFHAKAHPGTGVDIEQISIEIDEDLDVARFLEAWASVFARHRILGSTFGWADDGSAVTSIGMPFQLPVRIEDWSGEDDTSALLADATAAERATDFDLEGGPLHRLTVAELGPSRWWMLWTFHHAILDGRSFPIVLRDVLARYDAGPAAGPPEAVDVGRYLQAVSEDPHDDGPAFWQELLRGFESPNRLDVDRPLHHPDVSPPPVSHLIHELGETETAALRALAERTGCSLNTCVQAAWYLLLRHHTQQDFVTFGTTRACRHAVEDATDMVGLLINTVPLGLPVHETETVEQLLHRLRDAQRTLRAHETMPLPAIIDAVDVGPTLFDSIVVYDDASLDQRMRDAGSAGTDRGPDGYSRRFAYDGQTNFPLTLLAYGDRSLSLRLEFATDRYDQGYAAELLSHLRNLLVGFPEAGHAPAAAVGYLTTEEVAQYEGWNETDVVYDLDTTLQRRLEAQVAAAPDHAALVMDGRTLSYGEFNQRTNQLAHDLRERGIGPEQFVGVFAERSFELMIAVHAIVKAGGAYVPLDPDHPAERLRFMAADAGLTLVLTQPHLVERLPATDAEALTVDLDQWRWDDQPSDNPSPDAGPANVAYLLYTSGSTGRPKGVMIEHRSVINRLLWMQEAFPLGPNDVVLQKTPYTFDVSVWELFWPLLEGATLALAPPGDHRDPAALVRTIVANDVTTLHFVPSMLALFVDEPTVPSCATIKRIVCSGEALPRALQDRLFEVLDTELHNLYGPTEAAIDVTWWACDPESPLDTVPIGYPIANTQVHVLDQGMRRVPRGTAGELCIGGVQVSRGYHARAELTADRFVPDPYAATPNARLYRTGDLVRHRPDGAVEFLGRLDHQVKIHGQRIELGEIEAAIGSHQSAREVVVTASGTGAADAVLVAYVVTDGDHATVESALRDHCATSLAAYMVPTVWMFLDSMPLNANGKADRKALPAPVTVTAQRQIVNPTSATEQQVASVWEAVLEQGPVGTTDTFFEVGGNSLLLVVLAQKLTESFGRPVEVAELMRHTTVAAQAEHLAAQPDQDGADAPAVDPAVAAGRDRAAARRARRRRTGA